MKKNTKEPEFLRPITIKSFYKSNSSNAINPLLITLQKHIEKIAVHGFSLKNLKRYFEPDFFERGTITYIRYNRKIIGFFVAFYLKKTDAKGNIYYEGKGFPGIAPQIRIDNSNELKGLFKKIWKKLFLNFAEFYFTEMIFKNYNPSSFSLKNLEILKSFFDDNSSTPLLKLADLIGKVNHFITQNTKTSFKIYTLAENPIMYASLMNFDFDGPRPTASEKKQLKKWNSETLLVESYRQSKSTNQNRYLKQIKLIILILL